MLQNFQNSDFLYFFFFLLFARQNEEEKVRKRRRKTRHCLRRSDERMTKLIYSAKPSRFRNLWLPPVARLRFVVVRIITSTVCPKDTIGRGGKYIWLVVIIPAQKCIYVRSTFGVSRTINSSLQPKAALNGCVFLSFFASFFPLFSSQKKRGKNEDKSTLLDLMQQNVYFVANCWHVTSILINLRKNRVFPHRLIVTISENFCYKTEMLKNYPCLLYNKFIKRYWLYF